MLKSASPAAAGFWRYAPEMVSTLPIAEQAVSVESRYSQTRRHDYLAGRLAAHKALVSLSCQIAVVGREANGAPSWPEGYSGSISHVDGLGFALVVKDEVELGVDVEKIARVGILPASLFAHLEELISVGSSAARRACIFSIKEAMFKSLGTYQSRIFDPLAFHLRKAQHFDPKVVAVESTFAAVGGDIHLTGIAIIRDEISCAVAWRDRGNEFLTPVQFAALVEHA